MEPTETKRALLFPTQPSVAFLLASETAKEGHFVRPRTGALVQNRFNTDAALLTDEMLKEFSILKFKVIEHDVPITNILIPRNRSFC
jgi:hypothetical protein